MQPFRDRSRGSRADRPAVSRNDRHHLPDAARDERLVGSVQILGANFSFLDDDALRGGGREHRGAGDPHQDPRLRLRGAQRSILDDEDIARRALEDLTMAPEHQRLLCPLLLRFVNR